MVCNSFKLHGLTVDQTKALRRYPLGKIHNYVTEANCDHERGSLMAQSQIICDASAMGKTLLIRSKS